MAVHVGIALVDVSTCHLTARVLPVAETLTLTLRLLGVAAPGEILLSSKVERQVKAWYKLQAREVFHGDPPVDRTSAYVIVGQTP